MSRMSAACTSPGTRSSLVVIEPPEVCLDGLQGAKNRRPPEVPRERLPGLAELVDRTRVVRNATAVDPPLVAHQPPRSRGLVGSEIEHNEQPRDPATPELPRNRDRRHPQRTDGADGGQHLGFAV